MTGSRLVKGVFVAVAVWGIFTETAGAAEEVVASEDKKAVREIALYPGAAPGSEKWDWSERSTTNPAGLPMVADVVRPVLLHYPAEKGKAVGTAMIVAPGGGFRVLMMSYEGEDIARRLNAMGIDAFVLKYRLLYTGPGAPPRPAGRASAPAERPRRFTVTGSYKAQAGQDMIALAADDGRQAVRLVRQRADEFGVRPNRVGMIGFSAGGVVTSEAVFGAAETRPDFAAIIYGVGEIKEVPNPAPPLFLASAADDALAAGRTVELFTAYRKGKGQAELHIFQMGAHGFVNKGGGADHFMDRLEEWLRVNKLLSRAEAKAAAADAGGKIIPIWPDHAPGSEDWTQKELEYRNDWDKKTMVRNVSVTMVRGPVVQTGTKGSRLVVLAASYAWHRPTVNYESQTLTFSTAFGPIALLLFDLLQSFPFLL